MEVVRRLEAGDEGVAPSRGGRERPLQPQINCGPEVVHSWFHTQQFFFSADHSKHTEKVTTNLRTKTED